MGARLSKDLGQVSFLMEQFVAQILNIATTQDVSIRAIHAVAGTTHFDCALVNLPDINVFATVAAFVIGSDHHLAIE